MLGGPGVARSVFGEGFGAHRAIWEKSLHRRPFLWPECFDKSWMNTRRPVRAPRGARRRRVRSCWSDTESLCVPGSMSGASDATTVGASSTGGSQDPVPDPAPVPGSAAHALHAQGGRIAEFTTLRTRLATLMAAEQDAGVAAEVDRYNRVSKTLGPVIWRGP